MTEEEKKQGSKAFQNRLVQSPAPGGNILPFEPFQRLICLDTNAVTFKRRSKSGFAPDTQTPEVLKLVTYEVLNIKHILRHKKIPVY